MLQLFSDRDVTLLTRPAMCCPNDRCPADTNPPAATLPKLMPQSSTLQQPHKLEALQQQAANPTAQPSTGNPVKTTQKAFSKWKSKIPGTQPKDKVEEPPKLAKGKFTRMDSNEAAKKWMSRSKGQAPVSTEARKWAGAQTKNMALHRLTKGHMSSKPDQRAEIKSSDDSTPTKKHSSMRSKLSSDSSNPAKKPSLMQSKSQPNVLNNSSKSRASLAAPKSQLQSQSRPNVLQSKSRTSLAAPNSQLQSQSRPNVLQSNSRSHLQSPSRPNLLPSNSRASLATPSAQGKSSTAKANWHKAGVKTRAVNNISKPASSASTAVGAKKPYVPYKPTPKPGTGPGAGPGGKGGKGGKAAAPKFGRGKMF